jgi:hypothetical protein
MAFISRQCNVDLRNDLLKMWIVSDICAYKVQFFWNALAYSKTLNPPISWMFMKVYILYHVGNGPILTKKNSFNHKSRSKAKIMEKKYKI